MKEQGWLGMEKIETNFWKIGKTFQMSKPWLSALNEFPRYLLLKLR